MLRLVTIDLSGADLDLFERYEREVLALLPRHGARLELRVRSLDRRSETHLIDFPDEAAFEAYRTDPARLAVAHLWEASGARSTIQPVERV